MKLGKGKMSGNSLVLSGTCRRCGGAVACVVEADESKKEIPVKIGRNDPCPCGSGLKYKKCCANNVETAHDSSVTGPVMAEIRELLQGRTFNSIDEVNALLKQHVQKQGQTALDDFDGLSPEQMHRFLYHPFNSPQVATFPEKLAVTPEAPIIRLFMLLAEGIGEEGLKPTATGNLPRQFCRDALKAYLGEEEYASMSRYGELRSETDFSRLHVTRLVAELAGLVRKYNGRFILSRECRSMLKNEGAAAVYPRLFRSFVQEYEWSYQDFFDPLPLLQQSFLFTLYLLHKHGDTWQSNRFYEERFIRAFPRLLNEVEPPSSHFSAEDSLRTCYSIRCLERFARFFGLIEIERSEASRYTDGFKVKKLPLLEHVVRFSDKLNL